jgi:hypothetical protein
MLRLLTTIAYYLRFLKYVDMTEFQSFFVLKKLGITDNYLILKLFFSQ